MTTAVLAWIEAKYRYGYRCLFIATFFIDIVIIDMITSIVAG